MLAIVDIKAQHPVITGTRLCLQASVAELTCPHCFQPMRITFIETANGYDSIRLLCDDCGIEAEVDRESSR